MNTEKAPLEDLSIIVSGRYLSRNLQATPRDAVDTATFRHLIGGVVVAAPRLGNVRITAAARYRCVARR